MKWTITQKPRNPRLAPLLRDLLDGAYSAGALKQAIEQGRVSVNGQIERFGSRQIVLGDRINFNDAGFSTPATKKERFKFESERILYEDDYLLVYDKPSGIVADHEGNEGLVPLLQAYSPNLVLAHRLDKETSGVILFAKGKEIEAKMIEQFRLRTVKKRYVAVVQGRLAPESGRIENSLGIIQSRGNQKIRGAVPRSRGAVAVTDWKLIEAKSSYSVVECIPMTGRTHQIRIHLAGLGHPIIGDKLYGGSQPGGRVADQLLLHSKEIEFNHPISQEKICIKATLPNRFSIFVN